MHGSSSTHRHRTVLARLALSALALASPTASRASTLITSYLWKAAVSDSASVASRWNPTGVPGANDYATFGVSGTYTVTFPASVSKTFSLGGGGGPWTLAMKAPHTTGAFSVDGASANGTLAEGEIDADELLVGNSGASATLTLSHSSNTNPASLHTLALQSGSAYGDAVGITGTGTLNVLNGSQYVSGTSASNSWGLRIGDRAAGVGTVSVLGRNNFSFVNSRLTMGGNADLTVGYSGTGTLAVNNGGQVDAQHMLVVGSLPGASGTVTIGPPTGVFGSSIAVGAPLLIADNYYGLDAGHGEVDVNQGGVLRGRSAIVIGSPSTDEGGVLKVRQGGVVYADSGLEVAHNTGDQLELLGGLTVVRKSQFMWRPSRFFTISSQVGTPELRLSTGVLNIGPILPALQSQLFVGRGGDGTLRVTQLGTELLLGGGVTCVAESLAGTGSFIVDSSAMVVADPPNYTPGMLIVGSKGAGTCQVLHGSSMTMGITMLAASSGSTGSLLVRGTGSSFSAVDNLYIGGGLSLAGGVGSVTVDSSATLALVSGGGVNPPLTTVYPATGTLTLGSNGQLNSTGLLQVGGSLFLQGGQANVSQVIVQPTGRMFGWGSTGSINTNAGSIRPASDTDSVGSIHVQGSFTQNSAGHYHATLAHDSGPRSDTLVVDNVATLAGALDLEIDPSWVRVPGDSFTVLTCSSRVGTFNTVTWNGQPLGAHAAVVYRPTSVKVLISATVDVPTTPARVTALRFAASGGSEAVEFVLALPQAADVDARLYDVSGRQVAVLATGYRAAGTHTLRPPGALPSGAYFARARLTRSDGHTIVRTARTVLAR